MFGIFVNLSVNKLDNYCKKKTSLDIKLKGNYGRRVTYFILPPEDSRTSWYKRFIKKKKNIDTLFTPVASTVWDLLAVAVWQAKLIFNAVAYWQVNYYAGASDKKLQFNAVASLNFSDEVWEKF